MKAHIEAHYDENLSFDQLGRVPESVSFYPRISQRYRASSHAYLTQVRIRRAFLSKGRPIASVAYETGFVNQSHLTRQFKRIVGYRDNTAIFIYKTVDPEAGYICSKFDGVLKLARFWF